MTDLSPLCEHLLALISDITQCKRGASAVPALALEIELKRRLSSDMARALETLVSEGRVLRHPTLNSYAYELPKQP